MFISIFKEDCKDVLKRIRPETVDLIVTSPPYCMKKAYESPEDDINTFRTIHEAIIGDIYRILKPGGGLCWQVGYHISDACVIPLDFVVYETFTKNNKKRHFPLTLRNRIIWTFGHGLNNSHRFSGRHETILWFTKGNFETFNLDAVRIPQKYPGKKAYKGKRKGEFTGNPLGKNPSDVWDIPNVKANHIEKTDHPCQFPVAIPARLIRALTIRDAIVLDPFMGSGTTGVAAILEGRSFIGIEKNEDYFKIAESRIADAEEGNARVRQDVPAKAVDTNTSVAKLPAEFKSQRAAFRKSMSTTIH